MTTRDWIDYRPGRDGVELLEAALEQHVYDRHVHDSYAIGVTLRGVQRFSCESAESRSAAPHTNQVGDGRNMWARW